MPLPNCTTNTGKVLSQYLRAKDGTKLVLNYRHQEANGIRAALEQIRLKGDKTPSLSLIARRSMTLYLEHLNSSHQAFDIEVEALEKLATRASTRTVSSTASPSKEFL